MKQTATHKRLKNLQEIGFVDKLFDIGKVEACGYISTREAIEQLKALSEMNTATYRSIKKVTDSEAREQTNTLSDMERAIRYGNYIYYTLEITADVTDEEFEEAKDRQEYLFRPIRLKLALPCKTFRHLPMLI